MELISAPSVFLHGVEKEIFTFTPKLSKIAVHVDSTHRWVHPPALPTPFIQIVTPHFTIRFVKLLLQQSEHTHRRSAYRKWAVEIKSLAC